MSTGNRAIRLANPVILVPHYYI